MMTHVILLYGKCDFTSWNCDRTKIAADFILSIETRDSRTYLVFHPWKFGTLIVNWNAALLFFVTNSCSWEMRYLTTKPNRRIGPWQNKDLISTTFEHGQGKIVWSREFAEQTNWMRGVGGVAGVEIEVFINSEAWAEHTMVVLNPHTWLIPEISRHWDLWWCRGKSIFTQI